MEGHLTMSKEERACLVVMAKVMKSEMKISKALRCGSRDVATVADPGGIIDPLKEKNMTFLSS